MPRIADIIRTGLVNGQSTDEIIRAVHAEHPQGQATPARVAWYRRQWEGRPSGAAAAPRSTTFDASQFSDRAFGIEVEFLGNGHALRHFGEAVKTALAPWPAEQLNVQNSYRHSSGLSWDLKLDGSCEYELATPRLTAADWPKVVAVLGALRAAGATVDASCGLHVHHETRGMRLTHLRNLIRLWGAFDEPLHMALPQSRRHNRFAERLTPHWARHLAEQPYAELRREIRNRSRYQSLNLTGWWRNGRVEIRSHHGTLNPTNVGWWTLLGQQLVDRAQTGRLENVQAILRTEEPTPAVVFAGLQQVVGRTARVVRSWIARRAPDYHNLLQAAA